MTILTSALLLTASSFVSSYPWLLEERDAAASLSLPIPSSTALPVATPPNPDDPRFTEWSAPGSGDVRSPCPGLNACANHGFIPHSGKGNTLDNLIPGLSECFNMGTDFTLAVSFYLLTIAKPSLTLNLARSEVWLSSRQLTLSLALLT